MYPIKFSYGFLISIIGIILLIIYTYHGLIHTFYQQDEWLALGHVKALGINSVYEDLNYLQIITSQSRILTTLLGIIFFTIFPFNFTALTIYSLAFHIANSIIIYLIASRFLKNNIYSFIAATFFAVNSVSHQTVTWFGAAFGSLPANLLILISIYFTFKYIDLKKTIFLNISLFIGFISLYFKETGIFLFVLIPILLLYFFKRLKFNYKSYFKLISPIIFLAIFMGLCRIYLMLYLTSSTNPIYMGSNFPNGSLLEIFPLLIVRLVLYPLTSFALLYFNPYFFRDAAIFLLKNYYPYITAQGELVAYTVVLDLIASILSFLLMGLLAFIYFKSKKSREVIFFSSILFFVSIVPYVVLSKQYTYLEPRYYYIPVASASLIFALLCKFLLEIKIKYTPIIRVITFIFLAIFLFSHVKVIKEDINKQTIIGQERISFLSQLKHHLPQLKSRKNLFYFTADKSYLVENNPTPFQHGFGYSLLVLYYNKDMIPSGLLKDGYLFILGQQGYKQQEEKIFGYFYDLNDLRITALKEKISIENIYAFEYDSRTGTLRNISNKVRKNINEPSN